MNGAKKAWGMVLWAVLTPAAAAQIPRPDDAPPPLSPADSARCFQVPDGFRLELVASEPLVREPSGVCWDEHGQLFVCELHGYNLEGQYDIEELNRSGELDRVVRRIQADERHKRAAEAETYGTIKRLHDSDGDGRMDRAEVWADRLPPCLGICPARGGLVAACQTQVLFLADRDGDGRAEVREVLFEGFAKGPLERSINSPQWGPDNWIYLGGGSGGGTIRGKYLKQPVQLPRTDFRILPDGSAIEPIVGATGTMGFAFTPSGDRFVISTGTPGIFVAPLAWRYLARNPDVPAPRLERSATSDQRVWPTSRPHPWRSRRADDPGFSKFYTDRYGQAESAPNGYFTSACSPLVYQDITLPDLGGQLLACEPAQNFVHRAVVQRDGVRLMLSRPAGEEESEFLTSSDPWFHAIALSHAPDGTLLIVDFYREIIEDYSAIPRYLQQQYGLDAGKDHGRIWRLTHESAKIPAVGPGMYRLGHEQLAAEIASPHFWRRQTARRLLVERQSREAAGLVRLHVRAAAEPVTVLNALATLDGLSALKPADVMLALGHADAPVRRAALQLAERWLDREPNLHGQVIALATDPAPMVRLQLALSLGECRRGPVMPALVRLARLYGNEPWMSSAILTAVPGQAATLLGELLRRPEELNHADTLLEPLCSAIARRRDDDELSQSLVLISELEDREQLATCLRGIRSALPNTVQVTLTGTARDAVKRMGGSTDTAIRQHALPLITLLGVETVAERQARLAQAASDLGNVRLSAEARVAAVAQLADDRDPTTTGILLDALKSGTPRVRGAILDAVFSRQDRLAPLLNAIESKSVAPAFLSAVQRAALLEASDPDLRAKATVLLKATRDVGAELFDRYARALEAERDIAHGAEVFRLKCANCHQAHGIGHAVGPDLSAEFLRAEEIIVRDVLAPSDTIMPEFVTYNVATVSGQVISGLLASESPTSITLRLAEGKEHILLRKDVELLRAMSVSMMPEDLVNTVSPRDLANALAWLRRPPVRLVLLDENRDLIAALVDGAGTAEFITGDKYRGEVSLRITPPQRYSSRIRGWEFRVRERPGPGEYRYLRFAWKSAGAHGVMLELAGDGAWPAAAEPLRRYHAGRNTTGWQSTEVSRSPPGEWTVVTRDLWRDFGDFTLTGFAPTAMGGAALFDRIELLQK